LKVGIKLEKIHNMIMIELNYMKHKNLFFMEDIDLVVIELCIIKNEKNIKSLVLFAIYLIIYRLTT
jgi:hypothetical protein